MADEIDQLQEFQQLTTDKEIEKIRKEAQKMDPGKPGFCHICGEESQRLVHGNCAPCRDRYGLP